MIKNKAVHFRLSSAFIFFIFYVTIAKNLCTYSFSLISNGIEEIADVNMQAPRSDTTVKTRIQEHPFSGFRLIEFLYIGYFR